MENFKPVMKFLKRKDQEVWNTAVINPRLNTLETLHGLTSLATAVWNEFEANSEAESEESKRERSVW